jgi:hypothetical protein
VTEFRIGETISGATFLDEGHQFRVALWRIWDKGKPLLLFIGLNPSTATGVLDDATIRRVVAFAKSWVYGGLFVGNLFSLVTPDPKELWAAKKKGTGDGANDHVLRVMVRLTDDVLVGWGHFGKDAGDRPAEVLALVDKPVYCLGVTKDGQPKHPLYIRGDTAKQLYKGAA